MRLGFRTLLLAVSVIAIQFSKTSPAFAGPQVNTAATARFAKMQRHASPAPSLPRNRPPRIGDRGTLVNRRATIIQKIDDSNAIASVQWFTEKHELIGDPRRGIVVDKTENHYELVWLRVQTKELVNGRSYLWNEVFQATKTVQYQSNQGPRTIIYLQSAAEPSLTGTAK